LDARDAGVIRAVRRLIDAQRRLEQSARLSQLARISQHHSDGSSLTKGPSMIDKGRGWAGGGNAVYGLGLIGALVYYIQQAHGFWHVILADPQGAGLAGLPHLRYYLSIVD
jgi:hypothetical protein